MNTSVVSKNCFWHKVRPVLVMVRNQLTKDLDQRFVQSVYLLISFKQSFVHISSLIRMQTCPQNTWIGICIHPSPSWVNLVKWLETPTTTRSVGPIMSIATPFRGCPALMFMRGAFGCLEGSLTSTHGKHLCKMPCQWSLLHTFYRAFEMPRWPDEGLLCKGHNTCDTMLSGKQIWW